MSGDDGYRADFSRRQFVFGSALLAGSAGAVAMTPRPAAPLLATGGLEKVIPAQLGPWAFESSSGFILPPRDMSEALIYSQVLTRVYVQPGHDPVMLLIAYGAGQTGMYEIHRPEACYPSQGYRLSARVDVPLRLDHRNVPAIFWSATNDVRTEQVMYWTRIGARFPDSWLESKTAVVEANLQRKLPDGVLVRMSSISSDAQAARDGLIGFAAQLTGSVGIMGRRLLLGDG
jgi:EpsI family protein